MSVWSAMSRPKRTVIRCVSLVTFMGALSFAAVPLYDWFCRVTGYGGATSVATGDGPSEVLDQTVTVRFDSNVERGFPWEFKPETREVELQIGETGLVFYRATNPTDRPVAGTASFNVAPYSAGGYFTKIACFCFELQVLQPGETVMMPVTFYVDPEIVDDIEAKYVHTITLSYTFHESDLPDDLETTDAAPALGGADTSVN
ncbi:MAG: cytochrome c oxidase assembly protein [Pseudomonadota bacterium]